MSSKIVELGWRMNLPILQENNPLQDILDFLPLDEIVALDPLSLDEIRRIIFSKTNSESFVTDSYIVLLLKHLDEAGLINVFIESMPHSKGTLIFVRKC